MSEATFTLAEAARRAGVSESTMRRRLHAGAVPGAVFADGTWVVPVSGMIAAGLEPRTTPADAPATQPSEVQRLREEIEVLRVALAEAQARASAQAAHLDDLRTVLTSRLALGPAPSSRRWWRRAPTPPPAP